MTDVELIKSVKELGVKRIHLVEKQDDIEFYQCAINMYAHRVRIYTSNQYRPVKSYEMYDILKHMNDVIINNNEGLLTVRGMLEYIQDGGKVIGFFEKPFSKQKGFI